MMDNLEKVEKLKEKANISYEEAKEILEQCDWDLLDAVIELENKGKIKIDSSGEYSTKGNASSDNPKNPQEVAESYQNYEQNKNKNEKGFFDTLWEAVKFITKKGCENKFVIKRHKEIVFDIPVLLLIPFFWLIIILVIAGLFFGFSYNFSGPDLGKEKVNNVMDKATQMAEELKTEAKNETNKEKESKEEKNEEKDTDN